MAVNFALAVLGFIGIQSSNLSSNLSSNSQLQAQVPDRNPDSPRTNILDQLKLLQQTLPPASDSKESERAAFIESQETRIRLAETLSGHQNSIIRRRSIKHQFEAHRLLVQHGADSALEQFWEFAQRYAGDTDSEIAELGARYSVTIRLQFLLDGDREQAKPLHQEITIWINQKFNEANIQLVMQAIVGLEKSENYQLSLSLLENISKRIAESKIKLPKQILADIKTDLEAAKKRMSLVGQRFPLSGTLIDGQPLDPDQLTGKVVLVDFWASWCAPCRQEMPHIRKLLDRYQDQGFRVLGVCADEKRESALRFLSGSADVNWPSLMEKDADLAGLNHPLAKRASVSKLPTAILLGADGKVISIAARGANLDRWLATLFRDSSSK